MSLHLYTEMFYLNVKHTCTISASAKFLLQICGIGSIGKKWYQYNSILNHSKITKMEKSYCASNLCIIILRILLFVILLWFNIMHYTPTCFGTWIITDPYSSLKFLIFFAYL